MTNLSKYFKQAPLYDPPMLQFDGASYYSKAVTTSGNKITAVARINFAEFDGGAGRIFMHCLGTYARVQLFVLPNDHADTAKRNKVSAYVQNSAGTVICWLFSSTDLTDGENHTVFFSFDGDAGTAVFRVDGVDEDDTGNAHRVAPTTGTLDTTSTTFSVGASTTGSNDSVGSIGFAGYKDAYLTNWSDFMDVEGKPQLLDQFGWTQWGGGTFAPASQSFPGSGNCLNVASYTSTGNKVTLVCRFKRASFTGGGTEHLIRIDGPTSDQRASLLCCASDHATPDRRNKLAFLVQNNVLTGICYLWSSSDLTDGQWHTVVAQFDGDAGTASFIVDGVDEDDTGSTQRIAPTTGTLDSGASSDAQMGAASTVGTLNPFTGQISFAGYGEVYGLNWGDFMDENGVPKEIDELNWTEWGGQPIFWNKYGDWRVNKGSGGNAVQVGTVTHTPNSQPLFWHEAAKMDENLGSAGVMTENGTIRLAPESVIWKPDRGKAILTPGSAAAADLRLGKTAWVDGVKLVGDAYYPAMMKYNGASCYRIASPAALSGNSFTCIARIKASAAVVANAYIFAENAGGSSARTGIFVASGGNPVFFAYEPAGATLCNVGFTGVDVDDLEEHILLGSYNATTGAYVLYDRHTLCSSGTASTGTLGTTAGSGMAVGAWHNGITAFAPNGFQIGAIGYDRQYIDWSVEANRLKFLTPEGYLKAIDESGWTEWGSQPEVWNEHGCMNENLGSQANFAITSTIVVGKGGNE